MRIKSSMNEFQMDGEPFVNYVKILLHSDALRAASKLNIPLKVAIFGYVLENVR